MSKIFVMIVVFLVLNCGHVEASNVPVNRVSKGLSEGGKTNTQRQAHSEASEHAKSSKRQRVPKLERDLRNKRKTAKIIRKRRGRPHKQCSKQRKSKGKEYRRTKALEEMSMPKVITKKIGSSPILEHYIKRMGIVEIIDRMIPVHDGRKITHGEMVAGLMIYLLNGGRALYRMEQWAQETAILSHVFPKYQPNDWTDDRIADTLEELYKAGLAKIEGSVSSNIVITFNISLENIHYDTTSVSMWGTYDDSAGKPAVVITFGFNKDHRADLKQIVMGMAVSGDGGVPIASGTHNGNTSDSVLPISYWERLRKLAGKNPFCFIGDCKIASKKTLGKICSKNGQFLAPMPMTEAEQTKLLNKLKDNQLRLEPVDLETEKTLRPIYEKRTDRPSNRQKEKNMDQKEDHYKVCEEPLEIEDDKGHKHCIRKLIIHSRRLTAQKAETRERHLQKAEKQLQDLRGKLNKKKLTTPGPIEAAVQRILCTCKAQGLLKFEMKEYTQFLHKKIGKGRPGPLSQYIDEIRTHYDIKVWRDLQTIEQKAMLDGFFLMVSNLGSQRWTPSALLSLYKQQYKVERVFSVLKSPLAVSPMLLSKPKNICSMMSIMTFTLQLYTLIQRQVAQELLRRGYPLDGLMPNKIQTWRPQTDNLLAAFDNVAFVEISQNDRSYFQSTTLSPLQLEILRILAVPVGSYSAEIFSQNFKIT